MIAIVDFGMGNLRSVAKAIEHVAPGTPVTITSDAATIRAADRVVFPGQGAMPDCMRYLKEYGLAETVRFGVAADPSAAAPGAGEDPSEVAPPEDGFQNFDGP